MSFSKEIKADRVYYALFVDALSVPVQPDSSQNSEFQKESVLMFPSRNLYLGRGYPCLGCSNRETGCRLPARPLCVCTWLQIQRGGNTSVHQLLGTYSSSVESYVCKPNPLNACCWAVSCLLYMPTQIENTNLWNGWTFVLLFKCKSGSKGNSKQTLLRAR